MGRYRKKLRVRFMNGFNKKYLVIFIFVIVLLSACRNKSNGVVEVAENNTTSINTEMGSSNNSTTKENVTTKENSTTKEETTSDIGNYDYMIQEIASNMDTVSEYFYMEDNSSMSIDFIKWIKDQYGEDIIENIYENQKKYGYSDKLFYNETGKSIYVLLDEFSGIDNKVISNKKNSINMLFAGDLCLEEDGFVLDKYDNTNNLYDCIDESLINKMNEADIFMLNNEFSISDRGEPLANKYYTFRAKPERVNILKEMGVDIVSMANNHVYDYGYDAFTDTISNLKNNGIDIVGAGNNLKEASNVIYYVINGVKIGIISANRSEKYRLTPGASESLAGVFRMYDLENLKSVISNANRECDFLIGYFHWGTEDSNYFEQYQKQIAQELYENGLDIIIGGHPHVLQGIEYIDKMPIIYSLGDFWFNGETKFTGMLELNMNIDGIQDINFIPCIQSNYTTTYIQDEEKKKELFDFINGLSSNAKIDYNGRVNKIE